MMTHFLPEVCNCRKNGSFGKCSNFGSIGRSFSMGRVMTLRGSTGSPSSSTAISSRSRKFSLRNNLTEERDDECRKGKRSNAGEDGIREQGEKHVDGNVAPEDRG